MKIRHRLGLSFSLLLCLLFAIAAVSLSRISNLNTVTHTLVQVQVHRAFFAEKAIHYAEKAALCLVNLLKTIDKKSRVPLYAEMDAALASSDQAVEAIRETLKEPGQQAALARLTKLRDDYDAEFRETTDTIEIADVKVAMAYFKSHTQHSLNALLKGARELADDQQHQMERVLADLSRAEANAERLLIVLSLLALLIGIGLAWMMTRSSVGPVALAAGVADAIAKGDLTREVPMGRQDETGQLMQSLAIMRDSIASREDKILRLAYEDSLTGLPNRTRFIEIFKQLPEDQKGAIVVLDIDRFGAINNALGYAVGDRLLSLIGERFVAAANQAILVARLWGNEFAFLLLGAEADGARDFADSLLLMLKTPLILDGQRLDVGATLGVVVFPTDGNDAAILLRRATSALRLAKKRRVSYLFAAGVSEELAHENLSLIGEMREALEREEFTVYYQPKLNLTKNRVTGAEALIRWQHPDKGLVPPYRFIPFAEQTGFIRNITPWILILVIRHAAAWRRAGLEVTPSVNLSAYDLLDANLIGYVRALLEEHGLLPQQLCLEITESALMEEPDVALKHLNEFSKLGVKLSIDDYGSGQASLAYLKRLPVDELKIDREFVTDVANSPKNGAIVRSTIMLCHELGLSVVAEGAENAAEIDWLRTQGCDQVQGYGIAKPMPLADFLTWLSRNFV